ncbi:MAG: hypothetical protein DWQ06_16790 [Calditrichaeota bacterium]|nr:MAG: hypothetical protein DWQ06_16790 [Calditrichota bacterium]
MKFRNYDPKKDKNAVRRIWEETGWIEGKNYEPMDSQIENGRTIVADLKGEPECLVVSAFGDLKYQEEFLKLSMVGGVTTSFIARKQNLAGRLTATKIALDALDGGEVCGLGIFEQGFYNRLGFGNGTMEHIFRIAPSILKIKGKHRVPSRLTKDDWEKVHQSRVNRLRIHGSCVVPSEYTKAEMFWGESGFGLGYFDKNGNLTHHFWATGKGKENGPLRIEWLAYQTKEQFWELISLLQSLGDQIHLISIDEPPNIQFQDLLENPFAMKNMTYKATFANRFNTISYWQMRILDLEKCLAKTHFSGKGLKFNLSLKDPIERFLGSDLAWNGISGDYVVELGEESKAKKGTDKKLPILKTSVGAFTRLWLGILPASGLAFTDSFSADEKLIKDLDNLIKLPIPKPDWQF